MNRADRLRKVVPGAPPELVAVLAARPVAEVDLIVALARQARRDERQHQADRRRQRKKDDAEYGNYDEDQLAGRNLRLIETTALRAAGLPTKRQLKRDPDRQPGKGNLDAFVTLAQMERDIPRQLQMCFDALIAQGTKDAEIARALGVTRSAVGQRYRGTGRAKATGRPRSARAVDGPDDWTSDAGQAAGGPG